MYALLDVPQSDSVAQISLDQLRTGSCADAGETLETALRHMEAAKGSDLLLDIALHDRRASQRIRAVELLAERADDAKLKKLAPLLDTPPAVNWAFHTSLLEALPGSSFRVDRLRYLVTVDNIHIAAAAAQALVHG